jgi:hypothetical protein
VLRVTGDGRTQNLALEVPLVATRPCADDDFEVHRGFVRGAIDTATTGRWERTSPQATQNGGTTIQPGAQTTPGGSLCQVTGGAAGSSASANDVDAGLTDLLSPAFDLRHLEAAELSFDLWFTEDAADDPLLVQLSRDGGSTFELLASLEQPTNGWQRVTLPLRPPLTEGMVVRVRAQDQFASLVEALIDQFEITAVPTEGAVTVLGSGRIASSVRVGCNAPSGSIAVPVAALGLGPPTPLPGIGNLLLDVPTVLLLPALLPGANGYAAFDVAIPPLPGLAGAELAFQLAWLDGAGLHLGGNAQLVVLQ